MSHRQPGTYTNFIAVAYWRDLYDPRRCNVILDKWGFDSHRELWEFVRDHLELHPGRMVIAYERRVGTWFGFRRTTMIKLDEFRKAGEVPA